MANLKTHYENGSFVIEFYASSILNQSEVESIGDELLLMAAKSACSRIVVDLENVDFLSSAMIGVFIRFKMRLRKNDSDLKLCNASPDLMEMLKLTKLNTVFDIHDSRRSAIESFCGVVG